MTGIFTTGVNEPFLVSESYDEVASTVEARLSELASGVDASDFVEFQEYDRQRALVRCAAIEAIRE